MAKIEALRTAVGRGAELLDHLHPGWVDEIDCRRLDVGDPGYCVLAQLHDGVYSDGYEALARRANPIREDTAVMPVPYAGYVDDHGRMAYWGHYFGFNSRSIGDANTLTTLWQKLIISRKVAEVGKGWDAID